MSNVDTNLETLIINEVPSEEYLNTMELQPNQMYATLDENGEQSQYSESGLKYQTFDNSTLGEHLNDILGYINSENGGSLVSFGFKVGSNSVSATATNIQFNADGNSITTASVTPFTQGDFVNCTLKHINDIQTGAYFTCGINQISNATLQIDETTNTVKLSNFQITTNAGNGSPLLTYYENVDITNMELEHLTITYSN